MSHQHNKSYEIISNKSFDACIKLSLINKFIIRSPSYGGSLKSVRHFSQEWLISFFLIFCMMADNQNILKLTEPFFPGKFILPKFGKKGPKMAPKAGFFLII